MYSKSPICSLPGGSGLFNSCCFNSWAHTTHITCKVNHTYSWTLAALLHLLYFIFLESISPDTPTLFLYSSQHAAPSSLSPSFLPLILSPPHSVSNHANIPHTSASLPVWLCLVSELAYSHLSLPVRSQNMS